ncbi:MAG: hypothetical protein WCV86_03495 [Patescibacteria group bacterium]
MLFPFQGIALGFNRNRIIEDQDLSPTQLMSIKRIQQFLDSQNGVLNTYTQVINGSKKTAAEIIYAVAQEWRLSPQFFVVTLQKEQSLISDSSPSVRALNYAMGYGCPDSSPCDPAYAGVYAQIWNAARTIRTRYLDPLEAGGFTISGWKPGVSKEVDGVTVTPANNATAVLYTYTPHLHGNELFWRIWNSWFTITFPDGALLRARGEGGIWLIKDGMRHPFHSASAFFSNYSINRVVDVPVDELQKYDLGSAIKFPNFSLVQAPNNGVYLIVDDTKRAIVSGEVFRNIGFNPEELQRATWEELDAYKNGTKITLESVYPRGTLMQSRQTGAIYHVQDGVAHAIHSPQILKNQFGGQRWNQVEQDVIDAFTRGEPVHFRDGEIVTSPNANGVWYIYNGLRRGIPSPSVFETLGLRWENLIHTTDNALFAHKEGAPIDFSGN